jgi:hypothetical protein
VIIPPPEAQDLGPYRLDLVQALWPRIARVVRTLHAIGALRTAAAELEHVITAAAQAGRPTVDHADLARALCVMAAGDNMHVGDWMERTVYELQMPRRKAPAPVDLQIRLRGLICRRLVAQINDETESYRVTIKSLRGDVASVESSSFSNALEGAIKMAGAVARPEDP